MSLDYGDLVQMKSAEGEIPAGANGVVIGAYAHQDGDGLVVVRFEKATRLVHSASLELIDVARFNRVR